MMRSASALFTNPFNLLKHSGMFYGNVQPITLLNITKSNFDSLSPWEQVGAGAKGRRPEDLKPLPPPKPEEVKK